MTFDKILVLIFTFFGILFTYWFFLMKREKSVQGGDEIEVVVEGGYNPESVIVPVNKATKLVFLRKDPSSCLEEIVLGDFKIRKFLPLNEKVSIEITPKKIGEYQFSCGMGMFHGKLIVR